MIKIGVSASFIYPDPERPYFSRKTLDCFEEDMARYLARPGVLPILIPDLDPPLLGEYMDMLDGIVFQGGSDIAPQSYREEPIDPQRWPGDPERDAYELRLMDLAVARNLPVLGICRGCQLINVYFGGTLYQDLSTQKTDVRPHRDADRYDQMHHTVEFTPSGLFERIYGDRPKPSHVNSVHHQGIKDLADALRVEAICPDDGIIEAVSRKALDRSPVIGVQWHPEFSHALSSVLADALIPAEPLYDHFIDEVKRCKKKSP